MALGLVSSMGVTTAPSRSRVLSEHDFNRHADIFMLAASARTRSGARPDHERGNAPCEEQPVDVRADVVELKSVVIDDTGILAVFKKNACNETVPLNAAQCEDIAFEASIIPAGNKIPNWNVPQLKAGHALTWLVNRSSDPQRVRDVIADFQGQRTVYREALHAIAYPEQYR